MWPNPQFPADLVATPGLVPYTEEILNEKLHIFLQLNYAQITLMHRRPKEPVKYLVVNYFYKNLYNRCLTRS